MQWRMLCSIAALVLLAASAGPIAHAQSDDEHFEAAVRLLQQAVHPHRDGRHLGYLSALRSLNDPALAPIFSRLTSDSDVLVQINGILGLAEVSETRRIDPWLMSRLPDEPSRLQALNLAVGLELIGVEELQAILAWERLEDTLHVATLAELVSRGEEIDIPRIEGLIASENQKVRAVAAMLMAHVTNDREPFQKTLVEFAELPPEEQGNARLWLANDIGEYRLSGMSWWLGHLLATTAPEMTPDDELAMVALRSALIVDPVRGGELWRELVTRDDSSSHRITLGLLLLSVLGDAEVAPDLFDAIRNGDELTERLADAGTALAAKRVDGADAVIALLALDQSRSAAGAAGKVKLLPTDQAALVYDAMITRAIEESIDPDIRAAREELAVWAAPRLYEVSPERFTTLLNEATDDGRLQELLLVGLLGVDDHAVVDLVRPMRRIGFGRPDSLAILLIAKHAETGALSDSERRDLAMLAAGGGRLSIPLMVEAAWLHIRHEGKIESAMGRLFSSIGEGN